MLVIAALRWVDPRPGVDPLTGAVHTDPKASGPSAADECALAHALRIAGPGRCVAVTAGPPAAEGLLRDALAAGATDALRIDDAGANTAVALTAGIRTLGPPDVIVCGDHSLDHGTGATPALLAHAFGAAQALGLVELSMDGELTGLRRLDGGRRERLAIPLPAVCSVEPTGLRPPRASLPAVLAAQAAAIPVVTVDSGPSMVQAGEQKPYRPRPTHLGAPAGDAHHRVLALTGALTERTPPRVVRPASAAEAADELLDFLRKHGFLEP
ncbi:mycofactocin-associated electron transfer flavoprotein beta subunit [Labedaea rhizosphaerae]|uniref:Electron transfer flavoprotein small subunit n=1 Tax=Labedaea rhizosphaerae TaxID=598644 RepID=A0A4R6S301_LABRH|nr:mycofactocin-associated electron transfer flavoprotein beta subunit [Labedaea rhizosphaerae]TDP93980.1 electron transfer flavoprotein beta subunit [Labedaea rhizosphaerae]